MEQDQQPNLEQIKHHLLSIVQSNSQLEEEFAQLDQQSIQKENFKKSVHFALDELKEVEAHFNEFIEANSHLVIFKEVIQEQIKANFQAYNQSMVDLFVNVTSEEEFHNLDPLEKSNAIQNQELRSKLLRLVALAYLKKS